jgi:hypothetical protein
MMLEGEDAKGEDAVSRHKKAFLEEARDSIIATSEHEIYFQDEAGGRVLLYYDLPERALRNRISLALYINGTIHNLLAERYAKREGISYAAASKLISEENAAIIEELTREKRAQLKELIEDTVRQAMYDFWFEVDSEAKEKTSTRLASRGVRFTRNGAVRISRKRGVTEKKSIGKAGAPKGQRHARTTSEPKHLDEFSRRLKRFAKSYEGEYSKRLTAPIAAKRLGFGSERTMQRRLRGWGEDRRFTEILSEL